MPVHLPASTVSRPIPPWAQDLAKDLRTVVTPCRHRRYGSLAAGEPGSVPMTDSLVVVPWAPDSITDRPGSIAGAGIGVGHDTEHVRAGGLR